MESGFYGFETLNLKTMTNEKIYENVMGHKPNKEFGVKGSFSWHDIDALMNAVKNCSIPAVVGRSEQLVCEHPDEALIRDKPTEYCMAYGMNI